jgi:hypothetical protein
MLTSPLQQASNRRNAMRSTGPVTTEGKTAVRLNALKYGLRAKTLILPSEDPAEYEQLWADLESDWQPQTRTERLCLEQMATSQWLLARLALWESRCCSDILIDRRLSTLERISAQRARLERSFAGAMRDLERLQKNRQSQPTRPEPTVQKPAPVPTERTYPTPAYLMSEQSGASTLVCSPDTP